MSFSRNVYQSPYNSKIYNFANPLSGEFAINFDMQEHALREAMKEEQRVRQRRGKLLHSPPDWRVAQSLIGPHLTDYTPIVDDFRWPGTAKATLTTV